MFDTYNNESTAIIDGQWGRKHRPCPPVRDPHPAHWSSKGGEGKMKWPHRFGDQIKLMENLDYLYKMKIESGCREDEARKWIKEMVEIYRRERKDG